MKTLVKFLSVVILCLSTSLSAQRIYKMSIKNSTLFIDSVDSTYSTGITINTDSTPIFEFYDVDSKVVLGKEKKSNFTDDTIVKFMDMNDGDTKISDRLRFISNGDYIEFFYYSDDYITNYFTPQVLDKKDYVLKIKDQTKTLTYSIKNGKIEKQTL